MSCSRSVHLTWPALAVVSTALAAGCGRANFDGEQKDSSLDASEPDGKPRVDAPVSRPPGCGNGSIQPGEECDDGNLTDNDGCSSRCTLRPIPPCGDGVARLPIESCDDGNTVDGDLCTSECVRCDQAGDFSFAGHCYRLLAANAPFAAAQNQCEAGDGYVVSLETADEALAVQTRFVESFWLGLTNVQPGSRWLSGAPLGFSNFEVTSPPNSVFARTLGGNPTSKWIGGTRDSQANIVCEYAPTWRVAATGHAYRTYAGPVLHIGAEATCANAGGHLTYFETVAEFDSENPFAYSRSILEDTVNYRIGLTDRETEGVFVWGENTPVAQPLMYQDRWGAGEPNDANGEDFAVVFRSGGRGVLNDLGPTAGTGFQCEIE